MCACVPVCLCAAGRAGFGLKLALGVLMPNGHPGVLRESGHAPACARRCGRSTLSFAVFAFARAAYPSGTFSLREKVPEGRMRDCRRNIRSLGIESVPHPCPSPGGRGAICHGGLRGQISSWPYRLKPAKPCLIITPTQSAKIIPDSSAQKRGQLPVLFLETCN